MSNAMRTGKRWLAGAAAGALGAGLITFAAAPAAQASSAVTIGLQYPSVTTVVTGVDDSVAIPVGVVLTDVSGNRLTGSSAVLTNQRVQVTIAAPATADDTQPIVANLPVTSASTSGNSTASVQDDSPGNLAAMTIQPRLTLRDGCWSGLLPRPTGTGGVCDDTNAVSDAGTYLVTATLFNTNTGAAVSSSTMNINVIANAAANPASVTYISGPAISQTGTAARANILDRLGVNPGAVQATGAGNYESFALWVTDATGGPFITKDESVNVTGGSSLLSGTITTTGGWATAGSRTTDKRVYNADASANWVSPGTAPMTASVQALDGTVRGSATLPVAVSGVADDTSMGTTAPVVLLDTTPAAEVDTNTFQVPPGTTKLSFTVVTSTGSVSDTTVPYNGWSTVNLSALTPAGGVVTQKADTGTIEVTLPAASTVSGSTYTLYTGVGSKTTTTTVSFAAPAAALDSNTPLAKVGTAATINGSITDQYGNPLPGTWTIGLKAAPSAGCSATSLATATAAADGSFSIVVPASLAPSIAQVSTYGLCATNGITVVPGTTGAAASAYVQYTASGGVSSLALAMPNQPGGVSATVRPLIKTPANGTAVLTQTTTVKNPAVPDDSGNIFNSGSAIQLRATVAPQAAVTFTGTDGLLFTDRTGGAIFYQQATASLEVDNSATPPTTSTATANAWVIATKPGLHTVTVTAGSSTATYTLYAAVPNNAARTLEVAPSSFNIAPNSFRTMKFTVKDIFGNPVPFYGGFSVVQAGGGTLSPAIGSVVTNALGEAEQFYTAPAGTGDVRLDYTGGGTAGGGAGGAWVTGAIAGAPDAVRTATVNIRVGGSADKTIVIVGERGTVKGKPGIIVDGDANGFDAGAQFKPWVRFPGQTSYTVGTARPTANATGEFVWQRKTGKKIYVYFTSADDVVKSNRIIIAAN